MYRKAMDALLAWKDSSRRKPLVLKGARQVGKTWLMREFARAEYDDSLYISFDRDAEAVRIFDDTKDPALIIERLSLTRGKSITPGKTLVILDEIQECANALGSLKYFCEDANEYHVITAGSLLGTYLANPTSYPVGKVNLLNIYPLTFEEYLAVSDTGMYQYYRSVQSGKDYVSAFHERMMEHYKKYLIIGGMPECVQSWVTNAAPEEITAIQEEIISLYENDFTKHSGKVNSGRILQVFRSIVPQLAKENNEKFMYAAIAKSARAKDFEDAIEWLISSGIAYRILNVSKNGYPLKAYEMLNYFKLFLLDVGLIKHMAQLTNKSILLSEAFQFKGQLTENYVLEQLLPLLNYSPHYYAYAQDREIDFIIQHGENIFPIEIKSSGNKNAVSFKNYIAKYKPKVAVRFNTNEYLHNEAIMNIPLYFVGKLFELTATS
ncbi:MAG: AAA family ATPase [Deltaproteobacteria bacterium]|jgi:predicted AAA+ superfamily ATPase|nr:AAA family ATPase [Deltaproteobacteria bacterium]